MLTNREFKCEQPSVHNSVTNLLFSELEACHFAVNLSGLSHKACEVM